MAQKKEQKPLLELVPVNRIRRDGGTQARERTNRDVVEEYKLAALDGAEFPPLVVFFDGMDYWLADGFHRLDVFEILERVQVQCEVYSGSQADAQWYATGANKDHGLQRTRADKARAIAAALKHPNGAKLSDSQIAAHVGVSHTTVAKHRAELESTCQIGKCPARKGKDGRTQKTERIGRTPKQEEPPAEEYNPFEDDEPTDEPTVEPEPQEPGKVLDGRKRPVPERFQETFQRAAEFDRLSRALGQIQKEAIAIANDPALGAHLQPQRVRADIENARAALKFARPFAVCPYCKGKGCDACKQAGWVGRPLWDSAPADQREDGEP